MAARHHRRYLEPRGTGLAPELVRKAKRAATSERTRRAYAYEFTQFARWCECHGTTTPAMRSTGRAITLVSQTLGHADPTTSVYAHVRPNDNSSRYF